MNLKFGLPPRCAMLSTLPVTKLSMPMTLWPRAKSKSVKCEPRNPAAPVTTEVSCFFFIKNLFRAGAAQNGGNGAQQNFQIEPERPVVNVFEVEANPFAKIGT